MLLGEFFFLYITYKCKITAKKSCSFPDLVKLGYYSKN